MLTHIVVGVDPSVTHNERSDETGIVVAGKTHENIAYVLADMSIKGSPATWAKQALKAYEQYNAHAIVVETNQGGDLVETMLRNLKPDVVIKPVRATKSKQCRAAPIAMLYEQGKVFHTRVFAELEQQMCSYTPSTRKSPDRLDALVWALTYLIPVARKSVATPKVWGIVGD